MTETIPTPAATDAATGWTLCTIEDASDPGQVFPCMWNAATEGNGTGCSFVMDFAGDVPHYVTDVLADGSILTDDHGCAPYAGDEGMAAAMDNAVAAPPLTASEAVAQVLASPPAPELAHTGPTDPIMWVAAALMVTIGAVLLPVGKRGRRRSS